MNLPIYVEVRCLINALTWGLEMELIMLISQLVVGGVSENYLLTNLRCVRTISMSYLSRLRETHLPTVY